MFQHPPRAVQMIDLCLKILKSQPIHFAFLSCWKQPLNPDILPWLAYACTCTVVAWPAKQKDMDTRCVQMYLVSYPCEHVLGGGWTQLPLGRSGGMLPREDFFLNIEIKCINLVHFESKIKRSMESLHLSTPIWNRTVNRCTFSLWIFY